MTIDDKGKPRKDSTITSLDDNEEQTNLTAPAAREIKESKDREEKGENKQTTNPGGRLSRSNGASFFETTNPGGRLSQGNRILLLKELSTPNPRAKTIREYLAGVTELNLKWSDYLYRFGRFEEIGAREMIILAKFLPECSGLKIINVEGNEIESEGLKALARVLPRCPTLHTLNVSDTSRYHTPGSWEVEGMLALAKALPNCPALHTLYISGNKIGDKGMQVLAPALLECPALQILHAKNIRIGDKGVLTLIPMIVKKRLLHLDICSNEFGSKGVHALAQALPDSALVTLDMSVDNLDIREAEALVNGLKFNTSLTKLNLNTGMPIKAELRKEFYFDRNEEFLRLESKSDLAKEILFPTIESILPPDLKKITIDYLAGDVTTEAYLIRPIIIEFLTAASKLEWIAAEKSNHYYVAFGTHEEAMKVAADLGTQLHKCGLGNKVIVKVMADGKGQFTLNMVITPGQVYTWSAAMPELFVAPKVEEKKNIRRDSKPGTPGRQGLFGSPPPSPPTSAPTLTPPASPRQGNDDKKENKPEQKQSGGFFGDDVSVRPPDPIRREQLMSGSDMQAQTPGAKKNLELVEERASLRIRQVILNTPTLGIDSNELDTLRSAKDKDERLYWFATCLTVKQIETLMGIFEERLVGAGEVKENKKNSPSVEQDSGDAACMEYLFKLKNALIAAASSSDAPDSKGGPK